MKPIMLVVDDEPLVRMELVEIAEEGGFDTVQAGNAAHALRILESRQDIRVVFTDIRMPGDMDGLALAHVVRKRWPPAAPGRVARKRRILVKAMRRTENRGSHVFNHDGYQLTQGVDYEPRCDRPQVGPRRLCRGRAAR